MILALFLTIVFVFMAFYAVVFIRRTWIRYASLFTYSAAIFFVWNPELTTVIAHFFGIGRGLDFILTLFSVSILNGIFFVIKHLNLQHRNVTKLAQHIAIRDAKLPFLGSDN